MSTDLALLLAGAVLGLGLSVAFWWVQTHIVVPVIRFTDEISKRKNWFSNLGWLYRIKFRNTAGRDMIDVSVQCRLATRRVDPTILTWLSVPVMPAQIPKIAADSKGYIITVRPEMIERDLLRNFPAEITERHVKGDLSLDDLLALDPDAFLEIYVFGFDALSGTRKLFVSKRYTEADVRLGKFRGFDIVKDHKQLDGWKERNEARLLIEVPTGDTAPNAPQIVHASN